MSKLTRDDLDRTILDRETAALLRHLEQPADRSPAPRIPRVGPVVIPLHTRKRDWLSGVMHDMRSAWREWRRCRWLREGGCPDQLPF